MTTKAIYRVGVVVIGRNEGERLRICLHSLRSQNNSPLPVVYVDSGSSDDSVTFALGLGVEVVALDLSIPFTAARARNAGVGRLIQVYPNLDYVQFIDGDCELDPEWLTPALAFLEENLEFAVVCGRRRERYPKRSIYNLLCDIEWDGPCGEVLACGGDSVMRLQSFNASGGFRESLIAGEEPELCVRLRHAGWKIMRLDREMCLHDAAMYRFSQWWQRSARAGYAFAEGALLYGKLGERHSVRAVASSIAWALVLPLAVGFGLLVVGPAALWLLALYPMQLVRLAFSGPRSPRENWIYSSFLVVSKFSELSGSFRFVWNKLRRGPARLIEYK